MGSKGPPCLVSDNETRYINSKAYHVPYRRYNATAADWPLSVFLLVRVHDDDTFSIIVIAKRVAGPGHLY